LHCKVGSVLQQTLAHGLAERFDVAVHDAKRRYLLLTSGTGAVTSCAFVMNDAQEKRPIGFSFSRLHSLFCLIE
jgi:hypothetical protein